MGRGRKLNENCPSEGQFVQDSNKVYQKVEQGAERAATAKRQKVDDLQDSNKVCQKVAEG